jgi:hypothetical protein
MPQSPPNLPPEHPMDSPRAIAAQALKFGGLILACAGAMALIRTGEHSIFYALMMPVGIVAWFIGFSILAKITDESNLQSPPQQDNPSQQNNQSPPN